MSSKTSKKSPVLNKKKIKNFSSKDALSIGNSLAIRLYQSMLQLRSKKDILQKHFMDYLHLRDSCIQKADEVWKKTDMDGNNLTTFICEFPDHSLKDLHYIVVTKEDSVPNVYILLFSFPTTDSSLVDRYRFGENLTEKDSEHNPGTTHH